MFSDDFVSSPECFMYTTEVIGRQSAPDFVFTYGDMPAHHFFICLFTYMCDYADIDYGCLFTLSKDMTAMLMTVTFLYFTFCHFLYMKLIHPFLHLKNLLLICHHVGLYSE